MATECTFGYHNCHAYFPVWQSPNDGYQSNKSDTGFPRLQGEWADLANIGTCPSCFPAVMRTIRLKLKYLLIGQSQIWAMATLHSKKLQRIVRDGKNSNSIGVL